MMLAYDNRNAAGCKNFSGSAFDARRIETHNSTDSAVHALAGASRVAWTGLTDKGGKAGPGVHLLRVTDDRLFSTVRVALTG